MSGRGMGGDVYDTILQLMTKHPREVGDAGIIICSTETLREIQRQFDSRRLVVEDGYCGTLLGVPVWVDDRFDQPVLVSGL